MAPKKSSPMESVCLGCSKKFTSKCACILCTVCGLWIHKTCAGVTDEIFNFLDKQMEATGVAYWACRPCTVYAQGMNHRMRGIEEAIKEVKKATSDNQDEIRMVQGQVQELKDTIKKQDNVVTREEFEAYKKERMEESRERKARELNVVMHGVMENNEAEATGKERWEWDMLTCRNIFRILNLRITDENIKFCRRVGERGEVARPLIVGLYNPRDRALLLSLDTRGTEVSDVNFGPDLTKGQRKEDADMKREMEDKNKALSEEEKAKNLAWRMVGPRGERRLVKGVVRDQEMRRQTLTTSGRGLSNRGPQQPTMGRGRAAVVTRSRRGIAASARGGGMLGRSLAVTSVEEDEEEAAMAMLSGGNRERLNSNSNKRIRDMDGEMDSSEPPPKH